MRFAIVVIVCALTFASNATQALSIAVIARAIQPGELVILDITATEPLRSLRATAFGQEQAAYAIEPTRWRVLIGIDLDTKPGKHVVTIEADGVSQRMTHTLTVAAKSFPTRQLKVDDAFVNPPASALERIKQESALVAKVWASTSPDRLWDGPFVRPVPHQANSAFGSRSIFNGEMRNPHGGADFLSPAGTPVRTPNAGRVMLARDLYYSGQTVIVDHGMGLGSHFGHLSSIDVAEGANVGSGDVIGKVGATGRVTGAHLHWSVRVRGARVDPLSLLAVLGASPPRK